MYPLATPAGLNCTALIAEYGMRFSPLMPCCIKKPRTADLRMVTKSSESSRLPPTPLQIMVCPCQKPQPARTVGKIRKQSFSNSPEPHLRAFYPYFFASERYELVAAAQDVIDVRRTHGRLPVSRRGHLRTRWAPIDWLTEPEFACVNLI